VVEAICRKIRKKRLHAYGGFETSGDGPPSQGDPGHRRQGAQPLGQVLGAGLAEAGHLEADGDPGATLGGGHLGDLRALHRERPQHPQQHVAVPRGLDKEGPASRPALRRFGTGAVSHVGPHSRV